MSLDDYASLAQYHYALSSSKIRKELRALMLQDEDSLAVDSRVKRYYREDGRFVWIDRKGVDDRADTLVSRLRNVDRLGFSVKKFRLPQIERDLQRLRDLRFDSASGDINHVMARLEYNLTKAYLRYATGQRFGYVNPSRLFNHRDVRDSDSIGVTYRTLFDLKMEHADQLFFDLAMHKIHVDSVASFLDELEPQNPFYHRLLGMLGTDTVAQVGRKRLMVNMERARWRLADQPYEHKKYVMVNIPSFRLDAVNGDKVMSMRVGCGTLDTKTPLLASSITRMDINPQWIVPRSIIKHSVAHHVGNPYWWRSRHFFVRERATGKDVPIGLVTRNMLLSSNYLVIQEGGIGNSLGRVIFRFDNDQSIYLHDTSSRGVFSREDRGVSHGCVRVERPYALALFLLDGDDEWLAAKIWYSMNADVSPLGKRHGDLTPEQQQVADTLRRDMLVGHVKVNPAVPVYLYYYTLYPDRTSGRMQTFDDVYGYDEDIYRYLMNFMSN